MRAIPLRELRELLQSPAFTGWWAELSAAQAAERDAHARHQQLAAQHRQAEQEAEAVQHAAIETFSEAGGADEEAARVAAEAQAQEVQALDQVGRFEEQRFRTSDLWYRLGGAERTVELKREQLAAPARPGPEGEKLRAAAEAALRLAQKQLRTLEDDYAEEDRKRSRLWDQVEAAWERSFERSLVAAEHSTRSRRIIRRAELLFREAEEKRALARQRRDEAELQARAVAEAGRRRAALLEAARERLGCAAGDDFLYWRHPDDQRTAWAVALREEGDAWNLPVKPLQVFMVGRVRGAAFLEPAREGLPLSLETGDRRFEEYFLGLRRSARRAGDAAPAPAAGEEREP